MSADLGNKPQNKLCIGILKINGYLLSRIGLLHPRKQRIHFQQISINLLGITARLFFVSGQRVNYAFCRNYETSIDLLGHKLEYKLTCTPIQLEWNPFRTQKSHQAAAGNIA